MGLAKGSLPIWAVLSLAGAAQAQTYTVQNIVAPVYGQVAAGTIGNTIFSNNGTVTKVSGNGAYIKGTTKRATVTIKCANGTGTPGACSNVANIARVTVAAAGVTTGRAADITQFTASSGTGTVGSGTIDGATLDFQFSGWTGAGNLTFFLDTVMPVLGDDSGAATGAGTSDFTVNVAKDPAVPSGGMTASTTVTVRQSLQINKTSDLQFGTLVKPLTGQGTVIINASTGVRTTGGSKPPALVVGPATSNASYTITGEAGSTFTVTVPTSLTLTSGANSISATLQKSFSGAQTIGTGGSLVLGMGGTATIPSTTTSGAYSATFTFMITYN